MMLVCKQWQRAYLSTPALHSNLALYLPDPSSEAGRVECWLLSHCQQLEREGRLCTSLSVTASNYFSNGAHAICLEQLAGMLSSVPPPGLLQLTISLRQDLHAGLASWLRGMSRLTSLKLGHDALQQEEAAAIGALTQLQQLLIQMSPAPQGLLTSLLCLRQLTSLQLVAASLPPLLTPSFRRFVCGRFHWMHWSGKHLASHWPCLRLRHSLACCRTA